MPALSADAFYEATEALRAKVERRRVRAIAAALVAAGAAAAEAFEETGDAALAALATEQARPALALALAEVMGDAVAVHAAFVHRTLAPKEKATASSLWALVVDAYLRRRALRSLTMVMDTTRAAVLAVLRRGVAAGASVPDIARGLRAVWPAASQTRAQTIVRTEVVAASNAGAMAGAAATGLVLEKEWIATRDGRTRDTHAALDGVRVPMDAPFVVGGTSAMMPGDDALPASEVVNCRCCVAFVPVEDAPAKGASTRSAPARSWRDERDERMRRRYAEIKGTHLHKADGAIQEIADAEGLSFDQARRIIRKRRRS